MGGPLLGFRGSWYVVDATHGPWMTPSQASTDQPGTTDCSVHLKGAQSVGGAAGMKLAHLAIAGRDEPAPQLHDADEWVLQHDDALLNARRQALVKSLANRCGSVAAEGSALTTTSAGNGVGWFATMCRRRRFTRFLCTALPTFLETTKPTRVDSGGVSGADRATCTTTLGVAARTRELKTALKSAGLLSRWAPGSTVCGSAGQFDAALAAAGAEDAAAGAGAHTGAETMGAATASVARLERTLGHRIDSLEESCRNLPRVWAGEVAAAQGQRLVNDTRSHRMRTNRDPSAGQPIKLHSCSPRDTPTNPSKMLRAPSPGDYFQSLVQCLSTGKALGGPQAGELYPVVENCVEELSRGWPQRN